MNVYIATVFINGRNHMIFWTSLGNPENVVILFFWSQNF